MGRQIPEIDDCRGYSVGNDQFAQAGPDPSDVVEDLNLDASEFRG